MTLATFAAAVWFWHKHHSASLSELPLRNPVEILPALQFAILLTMVILLGEAFLAWLGEVGVYLLAAVSGSFDVDAVTLSISGMANEDLASQTASRAIVIAATVNTVAKDLIVAVVARGSLGKQVLIALLAVALLGGLASWKSF